MLQVIEREASTQNWFFLLARFGNWTGHHIFLKKKKSFPLNPHSPLLHTQLFSCFHGCYCIYDWSSKRIGSERRWYTMCIWGKFWNSSFQTTGSGYLCKAHAPQDLGQNGRETRNLPTHLHWVSFEKLQGWNNLPLLHSQKRCTAPQFCIFCLMGTASSVSTVHQGFQPLLKAAVPKYQPLFPSYSPA